MTPVDPVRPKVTGTRRGIAGEGRGRRDLCCLEGLGAL